MVTSDPDKRQLELYYRDLLDTHGLNENALGWTKGKQEARFRSATTKQSFLGGSVLDVGCGLGDFLQHLQSVGQAPSSYTGYDLVPEFVDAAKQSNVSQAKFEVRDFFEDKIEKVEHIVAFGIFNHLAGKSEREGEERLSEFLSKAVASSQKTVILDFLSDKVEFRRNPDRDRHWDPGRVLNLALSHSKSVVLDHGYLPFEFMVFIRPNLKIDRERAVFCD